MAKGKEVPKAHPTQVYNSYENGKSKLSSCPKCGAGVFMSNHKDRSHCGKCNYTEFKKKD